MDPTQYESDEINAGNCSTEANEGKQDRMATDDTVGTDGKAGRADWRAVRFGTPGTVWDRLVPDKFFSLREKRVQSPKSNVQRWREQGSHEAQPSKVG
jgi:hypothetical protein